MKTHGPRIILAFITLITVGCTTTRSSHHSEPTHVPSFGGLCPLSANNEIQTAQINILDLEMKAAQAQYDLDSAKIQDRLSQILQKRTELENTHDLKGLAQLDHQLQDLERSRNKSQQRLNFKTQWIDLLRASDCLGAQMAQDTINQLH